MTSLTNIPLQAKSLWNVWVGNSQKSSTNYNKSESKTVSIGDITGLLIAALLILVAEYGE